MLHDLLTGGALFSLPLIAMALFVAIFLTVVLRVLQRSRRSGYDHMATLPLADDATNREGSRQ